MKIRTIVAASALSFTLTFSSGWLATGTDAAPKLTDSQRLKIREAQIEVQGLQLQADTLLQQWPEYQHFLQLQQRKDAASQRLSGVVKEVMAEAKVSEADFYINDSLEIVPRPKPATIQTPQAAKP